MCESRNSVRLWVFVLLFGLTVGMAHAADSSTHEMKLDLNNQPVTENLVSDLAGNSNMTADTEILKSAVEPDCASDTTLMAALGIETALSASESSFGWTCGPCSISACANLPVGTRCGFNKYCVVTTVCSTQPYTDRCVCGTDHA